MDTTSSPLFSLFSSSINWNALSYATAKVSSVLLSIALFSTLSTNDFSFWANSNSIIFLLLLWMDLGLRKSLPLYCPAFSRNTATYPRFLASIIALQVFLLIACTPLFLYTLNHLSTVFHAHYAPLTPLIIAIFFSEGLIATTRLIHHSHFQHKAYNTLQCATALTETITTLTLIITGCTTDLLYTTLVIKIIANCALLALTTRLVPLTTNTPPTHSHSQPTHVNFAKHSLIMWFNTAIKSLTERNFMVPLITYAAGPALANAYKIANDGALLFYRTAHRSIGTTDTSLLAHTQPNHTKQAFDLLSTKLTTLCTALLVVALAVMVSGSIDSDRLVMQLFSVLTVGYLIEALLSPFERLLEVRNHYWSLSTAYMPYICSLILLYLYNPIAQYGLCATIAFIQIARLSGSLLMGLFAQKMYAVSLRLMPVRKTMRVCVPVCIVLYMLMNHTPASIYIAKGSSYFCLKK